MWLVGMEQVTILKHVRPGRSYADPCPAHSSSMETFLSVSGPHRESDFTENRVSDGAGMTGCPVDHHSPQCLVGETPLHSEFREQDLMTVTNIDPSVSMLLCWHGLVTSCGSGQCVTRDLPGGLVRRISSLI